MKPSCPGLLFVGRFLITVSISVLVMSLFLPGSVLESYTLLRICPFLPGCPFYWHIVPHSRLNDPSYFCVVCCKFSSFVSNFTDLSLVSFFLDESDES